MKVWVPSGPRSVSQTGPRPGSKASSMRKKAQQWRSAATNLFRKGEEVGGNLLAALRQFLLAQ